MEETKFDRSDGRGATRSLGDLEAPRQGQARPVNPSVLREWSDVQHGSLSDAVARLVHPRLQLAAPENPRLQWLRTLVPIFQALGESAARRFAIVGAKIDLYRCRGDAAVATWMVCARVAAAGRSA